ncbi:hypothetical protein V8B97DRAFT_2025932 [Scleroderma yunnanense]
MAPICVGSARVKQLNLVLDLIKPHIMQSWKACLTNKEILIELHKHINTGNYGIGLTKFMMYPDAGTHEMIRLLFHEHNMTYFVTYEPHIMRQQKTNHLQFNDIWAIDQHNKWLCFGLTLHIGIEPFSGHILWMKVWHSNWNPQLILSYYICTYIKVAEAFGHIPMVTQSDPSTENFGIANAQTLLQQMHDPMLEEFVQHRWMHTKKNIMPEIAWSQLRQQFTPGFEALLETDVDEGWYDPDNTLHLYVLPHGILELIYTCPQDYGALDFKVMVSPIAIHQLGCPSVGHLSAWTVYCDFLALVWQCKSIAAVLTAMDDCDVADDEKLQLLPGLQDLHEIDGYMGSLANGLGLSMYPQVMNIDNKTNVYNEIDVAPELLVTQFSSDDEEADEQDVENYL